MAYKHTMTQPTDRTLKVERTFDAPRDRVWRATTEPKLLAQWWGRGNPVDIERYEFVKGGAWRFVEHSDHGDHGFSGEFLEITPPSVVSMSFGWDGMAGKSLVQRIVLESTADGKTKLTCVSTFNTAEELQTMVGYGMEKGMAESYEALDKLLTTLK